MITKAELLDAIDGSPTMGKAYLKSGIKNYQTFRKHAILHGVWNPNSGGKGINKPSSRKIPLSEILNGDHGYYPTSKLKRRLVVENIKIDQCELCGISNTWNGKTLSLQLDHKDGNSKNHKLENLQIVCPNCHSQTSTFSGRNKNK